MGRLIVVSNRVALPSGTKSPGGLAVGVYDALRDSGGIWLGWNGETAADADADQALSTVTQDNITYATFPLAARDYDRYYRGFSNAVLWPVFHYRADLSRYRRADYDGYLQVNRAFVRRLAPLLRPDDVIWVHDYHLLALGGFCREQGIRNRIGFFLHIPFPTAEVFKAIPPHHALAQAMCAYDVVGFQTASDARAFSDYCVQHLGAEREASGVHVADRRVRIGTYPIGIDVDGVAAMARAKRSRQVAALKSGLEHRKLVISVDRLDYSKGLLERFAAFEQLLESAPAHRGRVSFVQLAPPSRSDVQGYREIRRELDRAAGRINGKWGELGWAPLRYINRAYERATLMPLLRAAQVGLVTPLRDGMNLVAKEYIAAQPPDDPGVLVLSQFAGAACEMEEGALIVNPYDTEGMADSLDRALHMPLAERIARYERLMQGLRLHDLAAWKDRFLADLRSSAKPGVTTKLPTLPA
ncbi:MULTISPECIES: alpha,alpha-trehalose-phosphate synthase (UDP-forming) [Bordetella]|uniref:Trehalose-6-phosphate synthase n=2 Tax=Bordetella TaxID=517 RepID=A0A261W815_9BORD|nr:MULTISPECIES: alpha,alpha-trehalose-phosphate synthase (UDP-forming) [Bordetella]MDM9558422.1 alpha,alpha-trehalose-phosphate synthase (UDP-forming) [Bordetella petrii]OZI82514.1 trehalose-6-phosphate synthase [Bordetella genomosp. 2]